MQLPNVRRIIPEDFPEESRPVVEKLAGIINQFMQDTVELSRKNIGYDNLNRSLVTIELQVDGTGKPKTVTQINTGLSSYKGAIVLDVQSLSGGDNVISAPYIDFSALSGKSVKINKVFGIEANKKVRITVEFIG